MTTIDILTEAKRLIEKNGFIQESFVKWDEITETVKYCASGAILVAGEYDDTDEALEAMCSATECSVITSWNDEPGRTKKEVLDAFDKAIVIANKS